jgi:uncharacterized protein YjbI with pentapeptide repeats
LTRATAVLASIAAFATAVVAVYGRGITDHAVQVAADQVRLAERAQDSDRFDRAMLALASADVTVRVGALYALGSAAGGSAARSQEVADVMSAFVRRRAPVPAGQDRRRGGFPPPLAADIQAALVVLGRLRSEASSGSTVHIRLPGTDLAGADLSEVDLGGADLSGADLGWSDLRGARLAGASLIRARADHVQWGAADLTDSWLTGASMRSASLAGARLDGAFLSGADLAGAHLRDAQLRGAALGGADLTDALLAGATLTDADLVEARLHGSFFGGADLTGASLRSASLTGAHFYRTRLVDADLRGVDLRGADLVDTDLRCVLVSPSTVFADGTSPSYSGRRC